MSEVTAVERIEVSAYTVPTDSPESDGTFEWDSTTMVLVEALGGGRRGLGYTYGDASVGTLIESKLASLLEGRDALNVQASWAAMQHALRNVGTPGVGSMAIAAGEYAWDIFYFHRMLEAVDILQADVTRCAGVTGLLQVDALCKARSLPSSAHCAPQLHAHACCAMETIEHVEYFHDHARLERMLFDGTLVPENGLLTPDPSRPGLGIELKRADAERYAA